MVFIDVRNGIGFLIPLQGCLGFTFALWQKSAGGAEHTDLRGGKPLPTSVMDMTLNNVLVSLGERISL